MRVGRIGGALFLVTATIAVGCTTAPAASTRPSASASAALSPAPASRPPTGSANPAPTPEPVVLDANGATTAEITAGTMPFVAQDGGRATCRSLPDSRAVSDITALELGQLGSGTLRAMLGLQGSTIEVFVDGGDLPDGSFLPFWTGPIKLTNSTGDGAIGTVSFLKLLLEADAGSKPGMSPLPGVGDWPTPMSGTISWSCGPWATPVSSGAPPPSVAP